MPELSLKKYKSDVRSAAASALNKMGARVKTRISTALRSKYNLKKSDVDKHIILTKANRSNMTIEIRAERDKIGLDHFGKMSRGASGVEVSIIKGKPVEIRIFPSDNYKVKRKGYKDIRSVVRNRTSAKDGIGTFTARRAKGKIYGAGDVAVFARAGKERNPVHRVVGPSIADLASSRFISSVIKKVYDSDFSNLLSHEIKYYSTR